MNLKLRALEPNDLELIYEVENDKSLWVYSNTASPFSRHTLKKFIEIIEHKQLRLVITHDEKSYGFIDLYDYDFINRRVGVGIIIFKKYRSKGIGLSSLQLTENYLLEHVPIHQVYANISSTNKESISLFEKSKYVNVGLKKDWIFYNNKFNDELLFQKILKK
jgi:diamine N-acetyltransferase